MAIGEVYFVSRAVAEDLLFYPDTAVISITDPGKRVAALSSWFRQVLRLSFYDAIPGDDFIPLPLPGCFDREMARQILAFVDDLRCAEVRYRVVVHCEQGVSRSAAVALFVAAYAGAPLHERERAHRANTWVIEQLTAIVPGVDIDIPSGLEPTEDCSRSKMGYCGILWDTEETAPAWSIGETAADGDDYRR